MSGLWLASQFGMQRLGNDLAELARQGPMFGPRRLFERLPQVAVDPHANLVVVHPANCHAEFCRATHP